MSLSPAMLELASEIQRRESEGFYLRHWNRFWWTRGPESLPAKGVHTGTVRALQRRGIVAVTDDGFPRGRCYRLVTEGADVETTDPNELRRRVGQVAREVEG